MSYFIRNKKYKTVYPDSGESYFSAGEALKDLGFEESVEFIVTYKNFKKQWKDNEEVYEIDGQYWIPIKMDHYNTNISEIRLAGLKKIGR